MKEEYPKQQDTKRSATSFPLLMLKFVVVLTGVSCFILYKLLFHMDFTRICFYDYLHEVLYPLNRLMEADQMNIIILIGQLLVDGSICFAMVWWTLFVKNTRIINILSFFYVCRTMVLKIWYFPFPDDIVWRATIVPSLFIPYDRTRDFFFSGHTGIAVLLFLEYSRLKLPWLLRYISFFTILWMPVMLITSRIHFTIDVLAAFFYAFQIENLILKIVYYGDLFWNVPYYIVKKMVGKCCSKEEEDNRLIDEDLK